MKLLFALFFFTHVAIAQTSLQAQVLTIAADAQGKVQVACSLPGTALNCDLNPLAHPPMQSVFKLPLAMAVLAQVEAGKLQLDQPVRFLASDRILPKAYSPLWDKYPDAGVEVPLRELLSLSVSLSDNVAADILLRVVGGPAVVDRYIRSIGVSGFHLEDNEKALHEEVMAQYRDWFAPAGAVKLLRVIADKSPLTREHTALLVEWMTSATRIPRLAVNLPKGTVVAHKTGTSDVVDGVAFATNDIGLITLPDGRRVAVAVFVTDAKASDEVRQQVIARIGRAVYDAAFGGSLRESGRLLAQTIPHPFDEAERMGHPPRRVKAPKILMISFVGLKPHASTQGRDCSFTGTRGC